VFHSTVGDSISVHPVVSLSIKPQAQNVAILKSRIANPYIKPYQYFFVRVSRGKRIGVSEWGSEGREFKSHRPDHFILRENRVLGPIRAGLIDATSECLHFSV